MNKPLLAKDRKKINSIWIYGRHSFFQNLLNYNRKVYKILLTNNTKNEFYNFVKDNNVKIDSKLVKIIHNNEFTQYLSKSSIHQGFAIETSPIKIIKDRDFISNLNESNLETLVILDQLTDSHNIGAIIRSCAAFDVKNIVITKHNSPNDTSIIHKSSSGMIEKINLIIATNLSNFLQDLQKKGYWCIGLDMNSKLNIKEVTNYRPIALVVGSEGNGIRSLVKKQCDILTKIIINKKEVDSLNASNAVAIALYEISQYNN